MPLKGLIRKLKKKKGVKNPKALAFSIEKKGKKFGRGK